MADFYKGKRTFVQGEEAAQVFYAGEEAEFIFGRGTQIFPNTPFPLYGRTGVEMILDADGYWFEFGFRIDAELAGNAGAGWTDARNYLRLEVQQSTDLETWTMGKFGPSPEDSVIDRGDGTWEYWGRCFVPEHWETVMVDLTASSNRYGKSVTAVTVLGAAVSLPNFPYAMPSQASLLQADLRSAGYTGATVTSVSAGLTVAARNHTVGVVLGINLTVTGTTVTGAVRYVPGTGYVTLSLPATYSMPSQQAALQAALRTAGATGAVVMLYGAEWTITLPDVAASGGIRQFTVHISPGDPYPYWDTFDVYQGLNTATTIIGESGNVRTPGGAPLEEQPRQFARLKISAGGRYSAYI